MGDGEKPPQPKEPRHERRNSSHHTPLPRPPCHAQGLRKGSQGQETPDQGTTQPANNQQVKQESLFAEQPWAEDQFVYETRDIAVIYTCAKSAKTSHVRMFLTINDAKKLCSDDRTRGYVHSSEWITMWTGIQNLLNVLGNDPSIPVEDDGRFLPICRELGLTPISVTDPRIERWIKMVQKKR